MRSILALTAAGMIGGSLLVTGPASAQTTVIERDAPPRAVVIERDEPPVVVERRVVPVERQGGCETKTVTRTEDDGTSTTVRRERCD